MGLVFLFIFALSLRQLSDPDLGFHLKYGKWITEKQEVPKKDISTYTVTDHDYTDLHWLFQLLLFHVYTLTGYSGLSLLICFLSLILALLLVIQNQHFRVPVPVTVLMLLASYILIDPRIAPRPEMFSFIFLLLMIFVLETYLEARHKYLFLLPLILLFWCNMHALFILGLMVEAIFILSQLAHHRKPDKWLLLWSGASFLTCFINPYGVRGFIFPLELLSRFHPQNIYNQHIQEFATFFSQPQFVLRDCLFLLLVAATLISMATTWRKRRLHEFILLLLFAVMAFSSIRNIPLFVLVAFPILSRSVSEMKKYLSLFGKKVRTLVFILLILIPAALILRIATNAWYVNNHSFNKTGMGLNGSNLPVGASEFLVNNHLDGRILNNIGFGGWLSWTIPQPVFIDGRLEVMQEPIYKEVVASWNGKLATLIERYKPEMIVFNYLKYFPWSQQLKNMSNWRAIYLDGISAVFAHTGYATGFPDILLSARMAVKTDTLSHGLRSWVDGFYKQTDYPLRDSMHRELFFHQMRGGANPRSNIEKAVRFYNLANEQVKLAAPRRALALYDSAIKYNPEYSKAYNNRGIILAIRFNDNSAAIADFNKALELDPGLNEAWLCRGTSWFFLHNMEAACRDWDQARKLGNLQAIRLLERHCHTK